MENDIRKRMEKAIERVKSRFSTYRTGRANPEILSGVVVDYYNTKVPLKQLASITVPENMLLVLNVFDQGAVKDVERAIMTLDLNLSPHIDGSVIRLRLPDLSEERRKELVKLVKKETEEGKIHLRNVRREYVDLIKDQEKNKEISEDELKRLSDVIQKLTDEYSIVVDNLCKTKESEILTI